MWRDRLRSSMYSMNTLLSQPFTAAQADLVARASARRRLVRRRTLRSAFAR
jgi:hypothetical protein